MTYSTSTTVQHFNFRRGPVKSDTVLIEKICNKPIFIADHKDLIETWTFVSILALLYIGLLKDCKYVTHTHLGYFGYYRI